LSLNSFSKPVLSLGKLILLSTLSTRFLNYQWLFEIADEGLTQFFNNLEFAGILNIIKICW
jgi:hypothetical protein